MHIHFSTLCSRSNAHHFCSYTIRDNQSYGHTGMQEKWGTHIPSRAAVCELTCLRSMNIWWATRNIGFPGDSVAKNPPANAGDPGSIQGSGRSLLRKWLATPVFLPEWLPSPVFLPREFHGQRSLASLSARQDWLTFTFTGWQYLLEVSLFYKPLSV